MKSNKKEIFQFFLAITSIILVVFFAYLFLGNKYRLSYANDHVFQTPQLYEEYARLLEDSILSKAPQFYSWNTFLGSNFYASKVYYCVGNIFLPLLLLMSDNILDFMLLESILCVYISAFSMYFYLKEMGIKNKNIYMSFAILFAIGGSATIQYCYPMFHRFYAFLPLLFLGVEKYLKHGKLAFFAIVTCILFLQNYYYMFPTTVFLPFYFLFSCYIKDEKKGFNLFDYLKKSIKLICSYIVGFMLSAVVMIPGIFFILGNNRLSYNELAGMITWPLKTWLGLFYYAFVPVVSIDKEMYTFHNYFNVVAGDHDFWYSIYCSSFSLVLVIASFFRKGKIKFSSYLLIFVVLLMMITPINSSLHMGTTPTFRFTFLVLFVLILVAAQTLDDIVLKTDSYNFKKVLFINLAFMLCVILISILSGVIDIKENSILLTLTFVGIVVSVLCLWLLFKRKLKLLALIMILEIALYSFNAISLHPTEYYSDQLNHEFIQYFESNDEDKLYRIYINNSNLEPSFESSRLQNSSLHYDYRSTSTYDTFYEYTLDPFIDIVGRISNQSINISNPNLFKLLGVKYVGISDYETLDTINEFEYAYDLNHIHMYKIKDYNHLGHTFSKFVLKEDIIDNIDVNTFDWNNTLIVNEDLYSIVKDYPESDKNQLIIQEQISNNNFNATIYCDAEEVLFISIPYDEGWTIKVDGIETEIYNVDGGFIGIPLTQGNHYIEAWYMPQGFKIGAIVTLVGGILFLVLIWNDLRISKRRKSERLNRSVNKEI